ncbi:MAG: hypothetical protein WB341_02905, partial [Terracidiphilus sp.]
MKSNRGSFGSPAQVGSLSELAHRARVQDGHRQALFCQLHKGPLFVTAGSFHGHQIGLMRLAKG